MPHSGDTILTLPITNAHFIWYCAWLAIPSTIYAYAHPATAHFAPIPAAVFATSLLYWRDPVRASWRRKLDMIVVSTGLTHHMYYAVYSPAITQGYYFSLVVVSIMSYAISEYYLHRHWYWPATYMHASIHLFANIANLILYYGINKSNINM
jgi:hypothetical protein